jgi:hypothetical protein
MWWLQLFELFLKRFEIRSTERMNDARFENKNIAPRGVIFGPLSA